MAGTLTISTLSDGTNSTSTTNCIQGSAKAWASFNGTTSPATINASYNVSSITRSATGLFVVNMTNAMSDTNYAISALNGGGSGMFCVRDNSDGVARTTSSFRLNFATTAPGDVNPVAASVIVFR
jgi:hypothetical protein